MNLCSLLTDSAQRHATGEAVCEGDGKRVTYAELEQLAVKVHCLLVSHGVQPGDRVGISLAKTIDTVAIIYGILRAGAAYVPVDPLAPLERRIFIFANCDVAGAFVEAEELGEFESALPDGVAIVPVQNQGGGKWSKQLAVSVPQPVPGICDREPHELAYILYTSGSTGTPKGVQLTHENAISFVTWCDDTFNPTKKDRFSSHAPFHFDLSIFDLYVAAKSGATVVLIDYETGKNPQRLSALIEQQRISIWYSAPSILTMLVQFADLQSADFADLRMVLFAGEVFPVSHLRNLTRILQKPRFFNLYGPTETNVCTYAEIPKAIPEDRTAPFPIGKICNHLRGIVIDEKGTILGKHEEGELCILGPAVTPGYWGLPERSAQAFFIDEESNAWYRTGDIVQCDENGDFVFLGRRDRMIKKTGYRIELGEIEACLYQHAEISEAAVVALVSDDNIRVRAYIVHAAGTQSISGLKLRKFCSTKLPAYMIPDEFSVVEALPKTSTDKIDYQKLMNVA